MSAQEKPELHDYVFDASDGSFICEGDAIPDDCPSSLICVRHYSQEEAAAQIARDPDVYRTTS